MTGFDDDQDMEQQVDEQLLTGHGVPGDGALVDVVAALRTMAQAPAPAPSVALAALLAGEAPKRVVPVPFPTLVGRAVRRRARSAGRWVGGLGLAGKVVLGAGVAMAGVTGAATIPAVPDSVQVPAHTVLTDVGHLFGGGAQPGTAPVPTSTPTRSPAQHRTDDRWTAPVVQPTPAPTSEGAGTPGADTREGPRNGSTPRNEDAGRPAVAPSRDTGTTTRGQSDSGSTSLPGQGGSGDQGDGSTSSNRQKQTAPTAPSGSAQPSPSPEAAARTSSPSWDR